MDELSKKIQMQQVVLKNAHNFFLSRDFYPIVTPKIVRFKDDEPDHLIRVCVPGKGDEELFLSRSPQLYKEIACLKSLKGRVYEIGPVFRGEPVSQGRRANEFLGLDVEIKTENLKDVISLLAEYILGLQKDSELVSFMANINEDDITLPKKVEIITYSEALSLLRADRIGTEEETRLSKLVTNDDKSCWIFLTHFPQELAGFYKVDKSKGVTESFDLISQWEICSGGLRRRDLKDYFVLLNQLGWSTEEFKYYEEIINHNPNVNTGGFGIGLERLIGAILEISNIGKIQPYPRVPGEKIIF